MNLYTNPGEPFRYFIDRRDHMGTLAMHIGRQLNDGRIEVMRSIVMEVMPAGSTLGEPLVQLHREESQSLMDALWNAGVRPADVGSAGHLAAVERHREEMSAIAIGLLRRDGVEL